MSADDKLQVVSAARFFDAIMNVANKKQEAQAAPRAQGLRIPLGLAPGNRIAPRRRSRIEECLSTIELSTFRLGAWDWSGFHLRGIVCGLSSPQGRR
jgi:hypothetical protein